MIANIKAVVEAALKLGISHTFIDRNHNIVLLGNRFYFANAATPLNHEDVSTICKDKEFTYHILNGMVTMPKTKGYFDPNRADFKEYREFDSIVHIMEDIAKEFSFPVMVKRNRGEGGKNVIKCTNAAEVTKALQTIYNQNSKQYDYVALAQEYIEPKVEFRVTVFNKKVELVYTWIDKKPTIVRNNTAIYKTIEEFVAPIFGKIDLMWAGIDIIQDYNGKLHLLELNSKPGFNNFCEHNGLLPLVELYKKVLSHLFDRRG